MIKLDAMENPVSRCREALRARARPALAPSRRSTAIPTAARDAVKAALRDAFAHSRRGCGLDARQRLGRADPDHHRWRWRGRARRCSRPSRRSSCTGMNALYAGMRFVGVPLDGGLRARPRRRCSPRSSASGRRSIFLAYPNNPTGNLFAARRRRGDHRARRPGSSWSTRPTTRSPTRASCRASREFPNLLVLRTLSKIGMAGLRLGYAVAAPEWIAEFEQAAPAV